MAPISYQGRLADDGSQKSASQDSSIAYEKVDSETSVAKILANKGAAVYTITETMSIGAAATELAMKKVGVLPVIDMTGQLVGILSERDIMRALAEQEGGCLTAPVSMFMTEDPKTCAMDDKAVDIMATMSEGRFRHMPVMADDMLCGIVSIGDLVNSRLQELEYETLRIKQLMVG